MLRGSQSSVTTGQIDLLKDCKLACCFSCSFCKRAVAKEKRKILLSKGRNKICERCFVCKSVSLCPKCQKCPSCCKRSPCGRPSAKVLVGLALPGFKSEGSLHPQGGVSAPLQGKAPPLTRYPVIASGSSNPLRNKNLNEALQSLGQKQAIERVSVQSSLGFYNRLFLVPKPNKKWRPILDLSQLNLYLAPAPFKMETPETIRLSLQQGEWVTLLDFSDAYFHIPINQRSRKYLRFHIRGRTFQFTALPFGLLTAPLEFTKVVKEVKLMAQAQGIRIHQYLDDWLLRAPCQEMCLRHTQTLLDLCRSLGWVVNMDKSELVPQQAFDFVGYHFDLSQGLVKPTQDRWTALSQKINLLLGRETCSVRQFMSLISLLTATEKQVVSGRLHMRPSNGT